MSKKILMVLQEHYPDDIRVSKEINSLQSAGFKIHLICSKRKKEATKEVYSGIEIRRITGFETHARKGITDIVTAIFFINPFYYFAIKRAVRLENYVGIHVHDLPLFKTARIAAKRMTVILDMHENYPDALQVWHKWKQNPIIRLKNTIFFSYKRWRKYEDWAIKKADHVITVVEEMKERSIGQSKEPREKFTTVSNMESKGFLDQALDKEVFSDYHGKFIVSYTGNVGPHRGVDTLIKSIRYLSHLKNLQVLIIGRYGATTGEYLKSLINEIGATNVELWGYQPFSKFFSFMKMSDTNIIPHNRNQHTDNTIPHKLFQAMMCNRPVIVSDCKPLKRVVEETNAGLVFKANDAKDLATVIERLYNDTELSKKMAENGKKVTVEGKYNWETESKKLTELYASI